MSSKKLSSEAVQIWPIYFSFLLLSVCLLLVSKCYFSGFSSKYTLCVSFVVVLCFVHHFTLIRFALRIFCRFRHTSSTNHISMYYSLCRSFEITVDKLVHTNQANVVRFVFHFCISKWNFAFSWVFITRCVCQRWIEIRTVCMCVLSKCPWNCAHTDTNTHMRESKCEMRPFRPFGNTHTHAHMLQRKKSSNIENAQRVHVQQHTMNFGSHFFCETG